MPHGQCKQNQPAAAAVRHNPDCGIMTQLMTARLRESLGTFERFARRHLHVIRQWRVKCLASTIADIDAAGFGDRVDGIGCLP
jgi:hypothetical protein